MKALFQGNGPQDLGRDGAGQHVCVFEGASIWVLFSPRREEPPSQQGPQLIAGEHSPLTTTRKQGLCLSNLQGGPEVPGARQMKLGILSVHLFRSLNYWAEMGLPHHKHLAASMVLAKDGWISIFDKVYSLNIFLFPLNSKLP